MGESSPELKLGLSLVHVPMTISDFLAEVSAIDDFSEKSSKLNAYVHMLEDEMRKIKVFKRELPLSMLLLNDAIERLKEEKTQFTETEVPPEIEEFIPLKGNSDAEAGVKPSSDFSEKKNWMSSAKLWTTDVNCNKNYIIAQDSKLRGPKEDCSEIKNPIERCKFRGRGGAIVPFKEQPGQGIMEDYKEGLSKHGLSLSSPAAGMSFIDLNLDGNGKIGGASSLGRKKIRSQSKPQHKKQRRRWSPELQRRFVNALQRLGGAHAATPKQIRELMRVEDLTNDEVKSHLQKYRLHVRKVSSTPSNGLRLAQNRTNGQASKSNTAQSESPQGPLNLGWAGKGMSITGGDSMEDEEDDKSEIHSWKRPSSLSG